MIHMFSGRDITVAKPEDDNEVIDEKDVNDDNDDEYDDGKISIKRYCQFQRVQYH